MSYGLAAALQQAVYERLAADAALADEVGAAIFDTAPSGPLPALYVALGGEEVQDRSAQDAGGAQHDFTVSVVGGAAGFLPAKRAAAAISDALVDADLPLARGRLISLRFLRAVARQSGGGQARRIDLRFRARVEL